MLIFTINDNRYLNYSTNRGINGMEAQWVQSQSSKEENKVKNAQRSPS